MNLKNKDMELSIVTKLMLKMSGWSKSFTLCVLEVMTPQRSDFVLTTDIPHGKTNVLVLDSLYIETWEETNHIKQNFGSW